jgi:pimeloyl-ACP methyl ester carboxylesterase
MDQWVSFKETAAVLLPALREVRIRSRPEGYCYDVPVRSSDGLRLDCRLIPGDTRSAIVVAHPAVVGSRYVQVVALAGELARSFSVFLFDFRGHGRSEGACPMGFSGPAKNLEAVAARARGPGFEKVGVAGFSLGAAAAFLAADSGVPIDALVSIGCPPEFPDIEVWREHPVASRALLRLLGMRAEARPDGGPAPIDVASNLGDFPKLLVFGEWEVAPPEAIARFAALVAPPSEVITVEGVWHADLKGRESDVRRWFERVM